MSEIITRARCKFCTRELTAVPHSPAATRPHCDRPGCRWCAECAEGLTSVSPIGSDQVGAAFQLHDSDNVTVTLCPVYAAQLVQHGCILTVIRHPRPALPLGCVHCKDHH
jgi:hypothetical protein